MPPGRVAILDSFAKAKNLPKVSRVAGGGVRTVYYRNPERVQIVHAKRVNGRRGTAKPRG